MGQKQMGHTLPAETTCKDSIIDMGQDRSALILIKHCRDMKQQEMCLRLITLFLLLICTALFIFMNGAILRQRGISGSNGQESTAEQSPAYSKQCPADNTSKNSQRLRIHLTPVTIGNVSSKVYMKWNVKFGENYNEEKRAIVIPKTDYYFVYHLESPSNFARILFINFSSAFDTMAVGAEIAVEEEIGKLGLKEEERMPEWWDACARVISEAWGKVKEG
ncbi:hypothetical protein D5F01_LYC16182 [Larimichthys crocea]|uniref:Uncharacterized protein n=1 Tax=Larimichthys crocea TaxID=215358 RepID=A0A6G0HZP7_LARCR|nr:hypothetical protein D5F01_LYC16182 [Larimichthys crocea]